MRRWLVLQVGCGTVGLVLVQIATLVPLSGALGALIGVLVTQAATGRRERKQWERQQEADDKRWERERQERSEQWEREDAARWERERFGAYSEILNQIEKWLDLATKASPLPIVGRRSLLQAEKDKLDSIAELVNDSIKSIELLAPEIIRGLARSIYIGMAMYTITYSTYPPGHSDEPIDDDELKHQSDEAVKNVWRKTRDFRDKIRLNLGINDADEK